MGFPVAFKQLTAYSGLCYKDMVMGARRPTKAVLNKISQKADSDFGNAAQQSAKNSGRRVLITLKNQTFRGGVSGEA